MVLNPNQRSLLFEMVPSKELRYKSSFGINGLSAFGCFSTSGKANPTSQFSVEVFNAEIISQVFYDLMK